MAMYILPEGACPSAGELALYVAGRLTSAEEEAIVTHLAQCLRCPDIVENLREADGMRIGTGVSAVVSPSSLREITGSSLISRMKTSCFRENASPGFMMRT